VVEVGEFLWRKFEWSGRYNWNEEVDNDRWWSKEDRKRNI